MSQYDLPDEISLTLEEAGKVLLALYDLRDLLSDSDDSSLRGELVHRLSEAIVLIQQKIVPDFPA
jgi:hypothetical protein